MRFFSNDARETTDDQPTAAVPSQRPPSPWAAPGDETPDTPGTVASPSSSNTTTYAGSTAPVDDDPDRTATLPHRDAPDDEVVDVPLDEPESGHARHDDPDATAALPTSDKSEKSDEFAAEAGRNASNYDDPDNVAAREHDGPAHDTTGTDYDEPGHDTTGTDSDGLEHDTTGTDSDGLEHDAARAHDGLESVDADRVDDYGVRDIADEQERRDEVGAHRDVDGHDADGHPAVEEQAVEEHEQVIEEQHAARHDAVAEEDDVTKDEPTAVGVAEPAADAVVEPEVPVVAAAGVPEKQESPVERFFQDSDTQGFQERWRDVQLHFVDSPKEAAEKAATLVDEAVEKLTSAVNSLKDGLAGEHDDTEALRVQLRGYRDILNRVLGL